MAAGARPGAHPPWSLAMPAPVLGRLPTYLGGALQSLSRDGQQQGLWSLRTLGRTDGRKTKPREDRLGLPTAEDDLVAAPKWPGAWQQLGCRGTIPHTVWSYDMEDPGPRTGACSSPLWAAGQEARDRDSSVSSGPLSGSSGGHESCALPHGPWRERPPQMLEPQRQPRKSNPRLEQLRDKIRAQTQWQASCASLGTSAPSSDSRLYRAAPPASRRKTRRATSALPAPTRCPGFSDLHGTEPRTEDIVLSGLGHKLSGVTQHQASVPREKTKRTRSSSWKREKPIQSPSPSRSAKCKDSELAGVYAWRRGPALVRLLLGPPPARPRLPSKAPSRDRAPSMELGDSKRAAATQSCPVHTWLPRPASACSDHRLSENTPSLTSQDQPVTVQTAMAILQDLRQQIQAGLELVCSPRSRRKLRPDKAKPQNPGGRRQQGPQSSRGVQGSFSNSPWAMTEGKCSSLDRTSSTCTQQPRRTLAEWESCPQRAWAAHGWDPSLQRARDPPEKLAAFSRRPWSALGGQTCPQRAQAAREDWEIPVSRPWSSLERPRPAPPRSWSSSFVQKTGPPSKGRVAGPHPLGAKQAWSRPTQGLPQNPSRKEQDLRSSASCPRPRAPLGQQHSSESLRDFMRQKAQARRQQALERKALATRTLELRNQRLQEVYRKQREAVLGKAVPVVSQTNPGIVTFVPSSARSEGLEAPESLASSVLQWSKVTSGKVLGGQEAPGRAWDRTETLETGTGAPLLLSTASSLGPLQLQDLPRGLCVYLDPQEADQLGSSGPLHFQYKQARLQALETMANVLKQRIDILTTKLRGAEASDTALDWPPVGPSTEPTALTLPVPTCPGALVPNRETGAPRDWVGMQAEPLAPPTCFPDDGPQLWSPSWESQSPSPRARHKSQPQGVDKGRWELEKRLQRDSDSLRFLGALTGSSRQLWAPDPTCSSLGLEDMPAARGAGLVMPWSTWSCGQQEPGRLSAGEPPSGHLADFQQKSSSFLESLKLNQQKQEQELALLQQQAEHEVWETQMALEELLSKHQLKRLMEKDAAQARPGTASKLEQLQTSWDSAPRTLPGPVLHSARTPSPLAADAAPFPWAPEEGRASGAHKEASAELGKPKLGKPDPAYSQLPWTRLCPPDSPTHQRKAERPPGAHPVASRSFSLFTVPMLEQNLREEELRPQHLAEVLRLREMALEERARAELACLEHESGCLALSKEPKAAQETLSERQQQTRSRLEEEQRDGQHLRDFHLSKHQDGKQLWQHQKAVLTARSSATCLQQELQSQTQLPQNSSPEVKTIGEEGSEPSQQPEGDLTTHRPHSPTSQCPQSSPECLKVSHAPCVPLEEAPPETASHADDHLQPRRSSWGEEMPEARSPLVESGNHVDQGPGLPAGQSRSVTLRTVSSEPGEQPRVPLLNLLLSSSLSIGQLLGPVLPMQVMEAEESTPTAQLRPPEAKEPPTGAGRTRFSLASLLDQGRLPTSGVQETKPQHRSGDSQTKPRTTFAEESPTAPTHSPRWNLAGQSQQSQGREGSCSPQEARVAESSTSQEEAGLGLDVAGSPVGEPQDAKNWRLEEQRVEACRQQDIRVPFAWLETAGLAASPAAPVAPKEEASVPCSGSLLPQLGAPLDLDMESASRTCCGSSEAPASSSTPSAGSASDLSCSSLQEFQKVTATLVQLSDSSLSLSGLEAEVTPDADLNQFRDFSVHDSWEELSPPLSWGLHQEDPQLGGVPGAAGCRSWPRQEGRGAGSMGGSSMEVAMAGGLESRQSLLQVGWSLPLPDALPPRSGSELSEASHQIWDEDSRENLWEAGIAAEPAAGSSWPSGGSSDLKKSGQPQVPLPLLGPREGQGSSGARRSLTSGSNTGNTKQAFPEEIGQGLPFQTPSTSDSDPALPFPSGTSTSGGEPVPPQTSVDFQEEPWAADLSLSTERRLPQTSPEPEVPLAQQTPEVSSRLDSLAAGSQVPGCGGRGASIALEEAGPPHAIGFLAEILSPVDKGLSCSSGDLLSSTHRDAHRPPTPPTPEAKSDSCSEDFPSPPEEAMLSGGSMGPLGEDTSIATEDFSEEALPEALSPGSQELGLCLGVPEKGRSLQGRLGGSGSPVGSQAMGSQGLEPASWPGSPVNEGAGSAPRTCVAQRGLLKPLVAGDMDVHPAPALGLGSWAGVAPKESLGHMSRPWEGAQGLESTECKPGSGPLLVGLDGPLLRRTVTSPTPWPAVPAASAPGPVPWLVSVGGEGEGGLSLWAEDQSGAGDSLGREQLPGGHSTLILASGPGADLPGLERGEGAQAVDLVSTQLTRRILCDSLAVLSGLVPQGSPQGKHTHL
ncbi:coiled-coil domain-containing protein 187 isoform X3 [Sciurus carolinensis]|uniref:coiled-coil domain-containing protein 187 isoform X3 n=1 Tax=Sciurus carolinensis TaxID=30640 RepID=UPI001FB5268F|nr:coiled-coil domain-containing protein 187 isoform X3 [Sciurus carolinensis]